MVTEGITSNLNFLFSQKRKEKFTIVKKINAEKVKQS